jgi:hypothetical protein
VFLAVSLTFIGIALAGPGMLFGNWVLIACGALMAAGAVGIAFGQTWCAALPVCAAALGVAALAWYKASVTGRLGAAGSAVALVVVVAGVYLWVSHQRQARQRTVAATREISQSAADALEALANGDPPPLEKELALPVEALELPDTLGQSVNRDAD